MAEQMHLPEIDGDDLDDHARPATHRRYEWYLDEETREAGRRGVAAAREALERARREAGRQADRAA